MFLRKVISCSDQAPDQIDMSITRRRLLSVDAVSVEIGLVSSYPIPWLPPAPSEGLSSV